MIKKMKFSKNQTEQLNSIKIKILKIYNTLMKREIVKNKKISKSKTKTQLDSERELMQTNSIVNAHESLSIDQDNLLDTSELVFSVEENCQKVDFGASSKICTAPSTKTNESEIIDTLNVGNMKMIFVGNNDQLSPSDLPFELLTNTNFETVTNSASVSNNQQCELFTQPSNDIENRNNTSIVANLQQPMEAELGSTISLLTPSVVIECNFKQRDNADTPLRTLDNILSGMDLNMSYSNTCIIQPGNIQDTLTPYPTNHDIIKIDNSPTNFFIYNKENIESYSSIIEESEIDQVDNRLVKTMVPNKDDINVPSISVTDKNPEIIIQQTQSSTESLTLNTQPGPSLQVIQPQSPSLLNYKSNPRSLTISPTFVKSERFTVFPKYDKKYINSSGPKLNRGKLKQKCNETILTGVINKNTDNITLVNGSIRKSESLMNRQRSLKKKIMETRKRYETIWGTKPIEEKVSAKFAKKFHVRIFDEPVQALTNIQYTPNFKNHKFPLVTLKNIHEQFKASQLLVQVIGEVVNKVVNNLAEENTEDGSQTTESDSDSDTSDEDEKQNRKWLKEYYFKRTKNNINVRHEEVYNDYKNKNSGAELLETGGLSSDQREINEELENILRNMKID
ncbi:uncharacterized protein [Euwallacea fornicatus]|uniref:uncharacterized protein n=1 Tax=Euwallacea fornicatus TaxID=995702 RepID=UPI0033901B8D